MQFYIVLEVIRGTVCVLLSAIQLAMTARAILSWFPIEPNKLTQFLDIVTEPVVYPIRKLFEKRGDPHGGDPHRGGRATQRQAFGR